MDQGRERIGVVVSVSNEACVVCISRSKYRVNRQVGSTDNGINAYATRLSRDVSYHFLAEFPLG